MQTERITIVLFTLFLLPSGQALRCYGCTGHDPSKPYNVISNNPACADGQFDATKLQVYSSNSNRFVCYAITYTNGASQVTQRYMTDLTSSRVGVERTTRTTFKGYYCPDELCNSEDTNAGALPCLAAPLLLLLTCLCSLR
ncbi:hypothetical protein C7M84_024343 [Penaeus vannamei]|uniref:Protein quiver n=1 Tax=Penaeus vannamei TaxID=6689 RepID=A0A3R7PTX7_PENVA|nr:uncharacterized protein LOC113800768 [Penaeus vannamei]ROT82488.1 hypothetical protein C7M84_024343 [Penaeus vannamei]